MAIEYRISYKCRLCGEIFDSGRTRDRGTATAEIALTASRMERNAHLYYPHYCNDTDIGLADFIGILGVEE